MNQSGALNIKTDQLSKNNMMLSGAGARGKNSSFSQRILYNVMINIINKILMANSPMSCLGPLLKVPLDARHGISPKSTRNN